tara:strand:+ start:895 stop:1629 length:735 start_codon:yes stop_codon:yes gene_type:complete
MVESYWNKVIKKDTLFEKILVGKTVYYFDKKGNPIKNLYYKSDSSKSYSYKNHRYDKYGNLIESIYRNDSSIIRHNIFVYNKNGNLLSSQSTGISGKTTIMSYKYDKKGNNIEELVRNEDGKFLKKNFYKYNLKNQRIYLQSFNEDETPQEGMVTHSYDVNGNEYDSRVHDFQGKLKYFYREHYDKFNNKILTEKFEVKGKDTILNYASPIAYNYDVKGNIIRETHYNQKGEPRWIYENNFTYW